MSERDPKMDPQPGDEIVRADGSVIYVTDRLPKSVEFKCRPAPYEAGRWVLLSTFHEIVGEKPNGPAPLGGVQVHYPDRLVTAAESAKDLFRLVERGSIPGKLLGWMVVTKCLHVLRCVFGGTNREAVEALLEYVKRHEVEVESDPASEEA